MRPGLVAGWEPVGRGMRRMCMRSRLVVLGMLLAVAGCGDDARSGAASLPPPSVSEAPATTVAVTLPTTVPPPLPTTSVVAGLPTIIGRYDEFAFYGPCGNHSIDVDGVTYFQLYQHELEVLDESIYPSVDSAAGFARVAPPGPGDDVGTLLVYSDGMARYESDSGTVDWFSDEPHTYNWEC